MVIIMITGLHFEETINTGIHNIETIIDDSKAQDLIDKTTIEANKEDKMIIIMR